MQHRYWMISHRVWAGPISLAGVKIRRGWLMESKVSLLWGCRPKGSRKRPRPSESVASDGLAPGRSWMKYRIGWRKLWHWPPSSSPDKRFPNSAGSRTDRCPAIAERRNTRPGRPAGRLRPSARGIASAGILFDKRNMREEWNSWMGARAHTHTKRWKMKLDESIYALSKDGRRNEMEWMLT